MNPVVPVIVAKVAVPAPVKTSHLLVIYGIGVLLGALLMAVIGDVVGGSKPTPVAQDITPVAPNQEPDPLAGGAGAGGGDANIARLIDNLGNENFNQRRQAENELAKSAVPGGGAGGGAVVAQIQRAALGHKDPDVRLRAQKVLKTIEAGEGAQLAGGGRAARQEEEEEEGEDPALLMQQAQEQQMMAMVHAELQKARAQMRRAGIGGGGAGGRLAGALGQMMGQQMGQLEQGVKQGDPNQAEPELPKLAARPQQPPVNNTPPPQAGGGAVDLKNSFGADLGNASGAVRVLDVQLNTAAAKAGLMKGDLITKINGRSVESSDDVQAALAQIRTGQQYRIELKRKGQPLTVSATR